MLGLIFSADNVGRCGAVPEPLRAIYKPPDETAEQPKIQAFPATRFICSSPPYCTYCYALPRKTKKTTPKHEALRHHFRPLGAAGAARRRYT
jgi:hypothetical protein